MLHEYLHMSTTNNKMEVIYFNIYIEKVITENFTGISTTKSIGILI